MAGFWRPERRNRNIGASHSGYSKSNDMRIPESWWDESVYYERLGSPKKHDVVIGDSEITILYQTPKEGFTYGCTPEDVIKFLTAANAFAPCLPDIIAFRQPTRKQIQQKGVWGRFVYFAEFGKHEGSAIILEAQGLRDKLLWSKRMSLDSRAEFNRLVADGHVFEEDKRHYHAPLTETNIRNTLLYRTLPHELGHLAHYHQDVLNKATSLGEDFATSEDLYFSKPSSEREVFAHAFATKLGQQLRASGEIPFEPVSSTTSTNDD